MSADRFYRANTGVEIEFREVVIRFTEPKSKEGDPEEKVALPLAELIDAMRKEGYKITPPADQGEKETNNAN